MPLRLPRRPPPSPPPFTTQAVLSQHLHAFAQAGLQARARDQQLLQAALTMSQRAMTQRDALEARIRAAGVGGDPGAENQYLKVCEHLRLLDTAISRGHAALGPVKTALQRSPASAAPVSEEPGPAE